MLDRVYIKSISSAFLRFWGYSRTSDILVRRSVLEGMRRSNGVYENVYDGGGVETWEEK